MVRDIPLKYRKQYQRAMSGKSRKAAMDSFCAECVAYDPKEVRLCTDKGCPLFPYRSVRQP
jgi:hypothetical protein